MFFQNLFRFRIISSFSFSSIGFIFPLPYLRTLPSMIFFFCVRKKEERGRERHTKYSLALSNLRFSGKKFNDDVAQRDSSLPIFFFFSGVLNSIWKKIKMKLTWLCELLSKRGWMFTDITRYRFYEATRRTTERKEPYDKVSSRAYFSPPTTSSSFFIYDVKRKEEWKGEKYESFFDDDKSEVTRELNFNSFKNSMNVDGCSQPSIGKIVFK